MHKRTRSPSLHLKGLQPHQRIEFATSLKKGLEIFIGYETIEENLNRFGIFELTISKNSTVILKMNLFFISRYYYLYFDILSTYYFYIRRKLICLKN